MKLPLPRFSDFHQIRILSQSCWFNPTREVPYTIVVPSDCLMTVSYDGAELKPDVLRWLGEHVGMNGYAVRTVEVSFLDMALKAIYLAEPNYWPHREWLDQYMAFITFEDDSELLHFKMRWS